MKSFTKYKFTFDDKVRKYCEEVLNESDESREAALQLLKSWIDDNPKLHIKPDEKLLVAFLRACKFDIDKTKRKIQNYFTMRRDIPEWFRNRNPLLIEIQELINLGVFVPLRQTHENKLVVIIRTAAHNPKRHTQNDVFKTGKMLLDVAAMEMEESQIYGVIAIFDMEGVTLGHAKQMTPRIIGRAVFAWENYHCRPQSLEFVNAPVYVNVVLNVFKGFMSSKLKSRVQVHFNGFESVHKVISPDVLPEEYGGTGENLKDTIKYWNNKLVTYANWFDEDEAYKAE